MFQCKCCEKPELGARNQCSLCVGIALEPASSWLSLAYCFSREKAIFLKHSSGSHYRRTSTVTYFVFSMCSRFEDCRQLHKPRDLSSSTRSNINMEEENQLHKAVLCYTRPYTSHTCTCPTYEQLKTFKTQGYKQKKGSESRL